VSLGKVCEGLLRLQKERSKLMDQGKLLKETWLGVGLVSNSIFLNGDIGIMGLVLPNFGKKNHHVIYLGLPSALLSSSIVLLCYTL
jgi:hypothetical protein